MFNSLDAWLDWQATLNPSEIELGLDRVKTVWSALGAPSLNATVITVAGTNGKGSSVALLNAIYLAASYRVGTYTSPHLQHYTERIGVQNEAVSEQLLCDVFAQIESARGETALTYFEFGTLAALLVFAASNLDIVILEVGLGGRLDAVNLIDADIALMTPIGLDHQDWLGNDIETIAAEKAGIMRSEKAAIYTGDNCPQAIHRRAKEISARLYCAGDAYRYSTHAHDAQSWHWSGKHRQWQNLPMPALAGHHQLQNAAGVLMVLDQLQLQLPVEAAAIRKGLYNVRLPGRLQYFPGSPGWLFDVAHNPLAAQVLAASLRELARHNQVTALFAVLDDKDAQSIAAALGPLIDRWLLPVLQAPRAMSPEAAQAALREAGIQAPIEKFTDVAGAVNHAKQTATDNELILVFGSFYTVGEAIACYQQ